MTAAMLYLLSGVGIGALGMQWLNIDLLRDFAWIETVSEVAVVVSLFNAGLKLRLPLKDRVWLISLRLGFVSMMITVALIALVAVLGLGLPIGAAILLGAILAPTDPVLASEVQLESSSDRDPLRFSTTSEAGLNDGTAFPMVMLGLGFLGLHDLGAFGWKWLVVDFIWAISGGLAIGGVLGFLTAQLVVYLRKKHREGVGRDEFLATGLIALTYGLALMLHTYGFLAVFAAGLMFRAVERRHSKGKMPDDVLSEGSVRESHQLAADPETAPAHMAEHVLGFNEQFERILEMGLVLMIGAMLAPGIFRWDILWFFPVLFLLIRPIAVGAGLWRSGLTYWQTGLLGWLGLRGVGSLYYLTYAISQGLPQILAEQLVTITLMAIVLSIVVHGLSATPLMVRYAKAAA